MRSPCASNAIRGPDVLLAGSLSSNGITDCVMSKVRFQECLQVSANVCICMWQCTPATQARDASARLLAKPCLHFCPCVCESARTSGRQHFLRVSLACLWVSPVFQPFLAAWLSITLSYFHHEPVSSASQIVNTAVMIASRVPQVGGRCFHANSSSLSFSHLSMQTGCLCAGGRGRLD